MKRQIAVWMVILNLLVVGAQAQDEPIPPIGGEASESAPIPPQRGQAQDEPIPPGAEPEHKEKGTPPPAEKPAPETPTEEPVPPTGEEATPAPPQTIPELLVLPGSTNVPGNGTIVRKQEKNLLIVTHENAKDKKGIHRDKEVYRGPKPQTPRQARFVAETRIIPRLAQTGVTRQQLLNLLEPELTKIWEAIKAEERARIKSFTDLNTRLVKAEAKIQTLENAAVTRAVEKNAPHTGADGEEKKQSRIPRQAGPLMGVLGTILLLIWAISYSQGKLNRTLNLLGSAGCLLIGAGIALEIVRVLGWW